MDFLWAVIVILIILFALFVILPSILAPPPSMPVYRATMQRAPHPAGPSVAEQQQMEASLSRQMLNSHYQNARPDVPEDHPVKPIGACPYSKPPSTDLPIPNVPMCVAVQPQNMRLMTSSTI